MLNISPGLILIPFFIYLFVHFFLTLVNVKHLFRTGALTFTSFIFTSIFVVYTLIVLGATWGVVGSFNWNTPISIDLEQFQYNGTNFE